MEVLAQIRESLGIFTANHLPRLRFFDRFRSIPLRIAGIKISKNVTIWSGFDVRPIGCGRNLVIGSGTFINVNFRCGVPRNGLIEIGENCAIGPNVSLESFKHNAQWNNNINWGGEASSIKIGDRVWIGARAVILGGVQIASDSVVAAGAVVTKDVSERTLVGGVPARVIKEL